MSSVESHPPSSNVRPGHRDPHAHAADQPFEYPQQREFFEPDWTRLPGYRDVTKDQWESAQWQRAHTVKNLKEFAEALGDHLDPELLEDIRRDQEERATMSMLLPPQMINTMREDDLRSDPVRRYMAPALSERETEWPSHPLSSRDSLHEADMWAVEGLTHRYPTKVLAELIPTCPQYCGHCTRMDLVGNDTLQVLKYKFETKQNERWDQMLDYLRGTPAGPRRRGERRRHGQRAGQAPRGLRDVAHGHREHPRHPDRDQGPDGPAPAFPAGRRPSGLRAHGGPRERARCRHRGPHPREPRELGDTRSCATRRRWCSIRASATCGTRACCSAV